MIAIGHQNHNVDIDSASARVPVMPTQPEKESAAALRQQMYARIAHGQALADIEDQARRRWQK